MTAAFLVGPRGAGKSSVGARAAALLGVPFVDSDSRVEERAGLSVAQIFARRGEPAFRALEREVMLELLELDPPAVVATGGGSVLDADVRARLAAHPAVIWLSAPLAELRRRVRLAPRPSLTGADPVDELGPIVRAREPLYRACAGGSDGLDTGALTLDQAAAEVARRFRDLGGGG